VQDIAAAYREGRRLFVLTTNLDAGRPVVWDIGAIASKGNPAALDLIRQVLLASSSIPGLFQPVLINVRAEGRKFQEMHSDGSIGTPFYVMPEALMSRTGTDLPLTDLYILINGKLQPAFDVSPRSVLSILGRSFSVALKAGERLEIGLLTRWAQKGGVPIHVAAIDPKLNVPTPALSTPITWVRSLQQACARS